MLPHVAGGGIQNPINSQHFPPPNCGGTPACPQPTGTNNSMQQQHHMMSPPPTNHSQPQMVGQMGAGHPHQQQQAAPNNGFSYTNLSPPAHPPPTQMAPHQKNCSQASMPMDSQQQQQQQQQQVANPPPPNPFKFPKTEPPDSGSGQSSTGGETSPGLDPTGKINDADISLATVPGREFNPARRCFSVEELKPQPIIRKRRKVSSKSFRTILGSLVIGQHESTSQ